MRVPFVDLKIQYHQLQPELDKAISRCLSSADYVGGEAIKKFEIEFAAWIGASYCISCANGSDAIELALMALGVGPGDEVIVPALTWVSTATSVERVGAKPIFADIDPDHYTIRIEEVQKKITKDTKAVIPVHLYGLPAPMNEIRNVCNQHNLYLIEDCAQAHGAEYYENKAGTLADISTFSFYPSKNLGAFGDAGAVLTSNPEWAEKLRILANVGQTSKNVHNDSGKCSRMDTLQASVLSVKLPYLQDWIEQRRYLANRYLEGLADLPIQLPIWPSISSHAFHLFVIQVDHRDQVMNFMQDNEITCQIHYPNPLPDIAPLRKYVRGKDDFTVVRNLVPRILSLPMYPELTEGQQDYVIDTLRKAIKS